MTEISRKFTKPKLIKSNLHIQYSYVPTHMELRYNYYLEFYYKIFCLTLQQTNYPIFYDHLQLAKESKIRNRKAHTK